MKEYKYKINGNLYKVSVGEIEKNIAHVEVNGTVYNVEMEEAAPVKVSAPKPSSAPRTATGEPVISKPTSVSSGADAVKSPVRLGYSSIYFRKPRMLRSLMAGHAFG